MDKSVASKLKPTLYEQVTAKIAAMIEAGTGTYRAPWHAPGNARGIPTNAVTHAEYRGANILSLWIEARLRGYPTHLWASYRQWGQIGAQVRHGEKGTMIVFFKFPKKKARSESQECEEDPSERIRLVARASWVFNAAQVDGFAPEDLEPRPILERIEEVEAFVGALRVQVMHGFSTACYRHDTDSIEMPERAWFLETPERFSLESYYAVLLHEITHWSGAPHRLNRQFGKRFGDEAYAFEELVAELGAAFMCAAFNISTEPRTDHAAYVSDWLRVLNRDPRAIFTAAAKAQEAFEYLYHLATRVDTGTTIG